MRIQSIISSSIGNIMEWYDFGLFAVYSPLFSRLFFPNLGSNSQFVAIFTVFAIGFLCRPLGALIFGYVGDKKGRARTLRLSILMISIPTLLVGFLPTYASIGILAPILLMLIRAWQGFSLGGEFSGNIIYLAEVAPTKKRGFFASFASMGANVGILLATLVSILTSYFFSETTFQAWGWRLPYLLSGIICLIIYFTRLQLDETHVFAYLQSKKLLSNNPIKIAFQHNRHQMLKTAGLLCMGSIFYYTCFIYMPTFLVANVHLPLLKSIQLVTFFICAMIILVPLSGWLNDQLGRRKILLLAASLIFLLSIPGFYFLLNRNYAAILIVMALFTVMSSLEQATTSVFVVENFPSPARYTGLSFGYSIGVALFGGTAPLVCEWLVVKTGSSLAPAFYASASAFLTGIVVFFYTKETRGINLEKME